MSTATAHPPRLSLYVFANAAGECFPDKARDDRKASHFSTSRQFASAEGAANWKAAVAPEVRKALEAGGFLLCKFDGWCNVLEAQPR